MDIHYKMIKHETLGNAPFVGGLVCASICNLKCKGCFNRDLKKLPNKVSTAEKIIQEIKHNPFNEGIILAGLEWSYTPLELVELAQMASDAGLKVMIYTGLDLDEFNMRIGKACAEKYGIKAVLGGIDLLSADDGVYSLIGRMILDYYITEDYYIKCGKYDATQLSTDRSHFGVALASENQNIYYIKKVEDEK